MSETKPLVNVYQEWVWHCPKCAARNCAEVVPVELTADEEIELREDYDIGYVPGQFFTKPDMVKCCECDESYEVRQ